jgi:phosphoribosylformylglycinamidine cyclo-ligase
LATGHLQAEKAANLVKGVADGCRQAGCALIGGETAEMPGFYSEGEYDMAGFAVGVVDKSKLLTGDGIQVGDVLLGISSSGIHSNGYSLVRKLFFEHLNMKVEDYVEELGETLGAALLRPTRIYVKPVLAALDKYNIKGICHITGGGFYENIPRMFKEGLKPVIELGTWEIPALFTMMAREGNIEEQVMFNTFNMGIGMVLAVCKEEAEAVLADLNEHFPTYKIGEVLEGTKEVALWRR